MVAENRDWRVFLVSGTKDDGEVSMQESDVCETKGRCQPTSQQAAVERRKNDATVGQARGVPLFRNVVDWNVDRST